jgi:transposase
LENGYFWLTKSRFARVIKGIVHVLISVAVGKMPRGSTTLGRPSTIAFLLTGGQWPDCIAACTLLDEIGTAELVHSDKRYDTNAVREKIEAKDAAPNIPPKVTRVWKNCFSPYLYKSRNAIERMFNSL